MSESRMLVSEFLCLVAPDSSRQALSPRRPTSVSVYGLGCGATDPCYSRLWDMFIRFILVLGLPA